MSLVIQVFCGLTISFEPVPEAPDTRLLLPSYGAGTMLREPL